MDELLIPYHEENETPRRSNGRPHKYLTEIRFRTFKVNLVMFVRPSEWLVCTLTPERINRLPLNFRIANNFVYIHLNSGMDHTGDCFPVIVLVA